MSDTQLPFGMDEDDLEMDIPILPRIESGPSPECPFCGEPMKLMDAEWGCTDCNGELIGPETG